MAEELDIPNRFVPSIRLRKYIYGVIVAGAGLALIYGLANAEQVGGWLILGSAVLGLSNGLALANTPK